jgi:hypothetical protein
MTPLSPPEITSNYQKGVSTDGIIVFRPRALVEVDKYTQVSTTPPSGDAVGGGPNPNPNPNPAPNPAPPAARLSDNCVPTLVRKLVTVADWDHPYRLHYEHGILEGYTFGATMTADGILTVVNSTSTPDQGKTFQNLASAAASGAAAARIAPSPGAPKCNATPQFLKYEQPPNTGQIGEFGSTKITPQGEVAP